ncbi:MAG: hypothetical protein LUO89_01950 [Methanothrix sp.]|nr:hypothetical protein [Methanothrix sp.]
MAIVEFTKEQMDQARQEIVEILILQAQAGEPIYYSELVQKVKAIEIGYKDWRLSQLLTEISVAEDKANRGMLSVLVVHNDRKKLPGDQFFSLAEKLGRKVSTKKAFWEEEFELVCGYWKSNKDFLNLKPA